jgi:hypothetical protein
MAACVHWIAEVLVPGLGYVQVPGEFASDSLADTEAWRFAIKWGGTKTTVHALECDGSCTQETADE